jgi:hypothetical protein
MILAAWGLLVFLATPGAGQPVGGPSGVLAAPETPVILPMRYYGNRPAVEVRVNGRGPFLFLIDTGAAGPPARADIALVRQLGLRLQGRAATSDAGGAVVPIDRVVLDRIDIGPLSAIGVEAYSRDYNTADYLVRIDGILGLNLFRDVLLTLDYGRSEVRLERGELPQADGRTILNYELVEGNPAITVRIGSRSFPVLLDSGNIRALDLPADWLRTMNLASFPRIAGSSTSVSGTVGLREVVLAEPLVIGHYRFDNPRVTFAAEFQEANLGSTILRAFSVTIDQKNRRVRLLPVQGRNPFR